MIRAIGLMFEIVLDVENSRNSCEAYCGPLSITSTSGIPCLENMDFRAVMILAELVVDNFRISMYREIIHNNNISFTLNSKRSEAIFSYGL